MLKDLTSYLPNKFLLRLFLVALVGSTCSSVTKASELSDDWGITFFKFGVLESFNKHNYQEVLEKIDTHYQTNKFSTDHSFNLLISGCYITSLKFLIEQHPNKCNNPAVIQLCDKTIAKTDSLLQFCQQSFSAQPFPAKVRQELKDFLSKSLILLTRITSPLDVYQRGPVKRRDSIEKIVKFNDFVIETLEPNKDKVSSNEELNDHYRIKVLHCFYMLNMYHRKLQVETLEYYKNEILKLKDSLLKSKYKEDITLLLGRLGNNDFYIPKKTVQRAGPKTKAFLIEKEVQEAIEDMQQQISLGNTRGFNASLLQYKIFEKSITCASVNSKRSGALQQRKEYDQDAYNAILAMEKAGATEIKLNKGQEEFSTGELIQIYKYFSDGEIKGILREINIPSLFILHENYLGAQKRIKVFAAVRTGSGDDFEKMPNNLKPLFAIAKLLEGDFDFWDTYTQKEEAKSQKISEKRKKQRQKYKANKIKKLQQKKIEEKKKKTILAAKAKESHKGKRPVAVAIEAESDHYTVPGTPQQNDIKREVQTIVKEKQDRDERKKAAKDAKDKTVLTPTTTAPNPETEEVTEEIQASPFTVSKSVYKLYQTLYSTKPKLTQKQALKLLAGFGLKVDASQGKGTHIKCTAEVDECTFVKGEKISTATGQIIFTCPDFKSFMTIVPEWESKDIPPYMAKALRHILEKIGVKEEYVTVR